MENTPTTSGRSECPAASADWTVTRQDFLKASGTVLAGLSAGAPFAGAAEPARKATLCFGMVTDAHYAETDMKNARYYRESAAKMSECVSLMNDRNVDFLIELGDFKDADTPVSEESTLKYLEAIETIFRRFKGPRYHVLGNHDVDSLSKEQFLARVENTGIAKGAKYYSFDAKGFHFVVLDANYSADGSDYDHGRFDWRDTHVPHEELDWLKADLASTSNPVILFVHQQLAGNDNQCVKNAVEVRQVLQENRNVLAVFQGHNHAGHYSCIEGIHYYTLKAMVEGTGESNNSYAIVEVHNHRSIVVTGYRRAVGREMETA